MTIFRIFLFASCSLLPAPCSLRYIFSDRLPQPQPPFHPLVNGAVDLLPGLPGEAELTPLQGLFDVFRGVADPGHLEIVNQAGPVQGDPVNPTPPGQVYYYRGEPGLDHVTSHPPQDQAFLASGLPNSFNKFSKILGQQKVRQALHEPRKFPVTGGPGRPGEVFHPHLALSGLQRIGFPSEHFFYSD